MSRYTTLDPHLEVLCAPCRYTKDHECLGTVRAAILVADGIKDYRCGCKGCRATSK